MAVRVYVMCLNNVKIMSVATIYRDESFVCVSDEEKTFYLSEKSD